MPKVKPGTELKIKKNITIFKSQIIKAEKIALEILGSKNVSGLFSYWINNYKLKNKKP